MEKPLDELYFVWLYGQVGDPGIKNPRRTYWKILKQLYNKEFVWIVPNDDNRVADGRDLRYEFVDQSGLTDVDPGWVNLGCSMLELLIGLSRRLSFEVDGEPRDWFWRLMQNLNLSNYNDRDFIPYSQVDCALDTVIWRNYSPDGLGGIFPLRDPHQDQRKIELWYQMHAYLLEVG